LAGEKNVVGFDIAVNYAVLVGVRERAQNIAEYPSDVMNGKLSRASEADAQRLALNEWHCIIREPAANPGAVYGYYVRVLEPGSELNLAAKSFDVYGGGQLRKKHLDHNLPAK
jgi:hypothetical protein